jgi:predicted nucleic acid-binding Zn ribbon protein
MTRQPVRLGDALQSFLRDSGLEDRVEEAAILPEWAARVGPAIAGVTTPVSVSRGILLVAVGTSGWLMELRLMERDILRRLNEGRERGRIEHIRFVMADGEADGGQAARRPRRPRKRSS